MGPFSLLKTPDKILKSNLVKLASREWQIQKQILIFKTPLKGLTNKGSLNVSLDTWPSHWNTGGERTFGDSIQASLSLPLCVCANVTTLAISAHIYTRMRTHTPDAAVWAACQWALHKRCAWKRDRFQQQILITEDKIKIPSTLLR